MNLERNNPAPLYEQLKKLIEEQIYTGQLEPGEQIPSERELCEQFGVSRVTVRQAIALAVHEGLLYRTHGRGTFVAENNKVEQGLQEVSSFQDSLTRQGIIATTKILEIEVLPNDLYLSRLLNVKMQEQIMNLQLIGLGNKDPVVYYNSYFSYDLGRKIADRAEEVVQQAKPFSTLDLYQEDMGPLPTHVEQTFESIPADEKIAEKLSVEIGFPILLVTSIVYSNEISLEYKISHYRGDKYKFFITRKFGPIFNNRRVNQE